MKWQAGVAIVLLLTTVSAAKSEPAIDGQMKVILDDARSKMQSLLDDERQHAVTAHDFEIVYGFQISKLVKSISDQLSGLGTAAIPGLIKYIEGATRDKPAEYACAVACTNALGKFATPAFEPTIQAFKKHPQQKELFLNVLLISFPSSLNYVGKAAVTAEAGDQQVYADLVSGMMQHTYGQFWENGVSSAAEATRQAYGKDAWVEPMTFTAQPVDRMNSPQAPLLAADLIRIPTALEPALLRKLDNNNDQTDRSAAIVALGFIDPPDSKLLPKMESILGDSTAVETHKSAAETLGRVIFRMAERAHAGGQKAPAQVLSDAEVTKAWAALKGVESEHFASPSAAMAICETGAAVPNAPRLVVESVENSDYHYGGLRGLTVDLMKLNGSPSPWVVLPALMRVAKMEPPREMGLEEIGKQRAREDARKVLDQLKTNSSDLLNRIAAGNDAGAASAKEILATQWVESARQRNAELRQRQSESTDQKIARLRQDIKTKDAEKFNQSLMEIGRLGPAAASLATDVVAAYKARNLGDSPDARNVQIFLQSLGPAAAPTMPWLIETLNSQYGSVQWGAIEALGAMGTAASSSDKALRAYVMKNPGALEFANKHGFSKIGLALMTEKDLGDAAWKKEKALDYLEHAPSGDYVRLTFQFLMQQGPQAAYAVPKLIAYGQKTKINDKYWGARMELCIIFRQIGPGASQAIPLLESWLQDKYVSLSAQEALAAIRGTNAR